MADYGVLSANSGNNLTPNIPINSIFEAKRVKSIVLDSTHPRWKELGEWNGLGTIEYQDIILPLELKVYPTAKPLLSNTKQLPLLNEIIYIIKLPNTKLDEFTGNVTEYYIDTISLWNHPHHNAYPTNLPALPPEQQKDYLTTTVGSFRRVGAKDNTDKSTEINLGKTFNERSNIHPLLPFEGDVIQEGRWGNSIRFSSTIKNKKTGQSLNNWSLTGTSGDPITIIRNGQGQRTDEGWVPIIEEINNDDSSIYLTSTQSIPLIASSTNYFSYPTGLTPTIPNQYVGKQIIINSGRLVFNSSENHLLLSSAKSIGLSSANTVNIDASTFTVQTNKIYLGSKTATEPLLLGNSTVQLLRDLIKGLKGFTDILSIQTNMPSGGSIPLEPMATNSKLLGKLLDDLDNNLNTITSKDNFTS